ncbi:MAG TPA: hypothetical protein VIL46_01470, partial [Gemmataceae bacterium]
MKIRPSWHALAIASALLLLGAAAAALAQQPPPPRPLPSGAVDEGIEVRTRGPIHEAFARPPSTGTVPELNPDRPPPGPVQEIPPPQRPSRDGEAAEWIPG